MDIKTLQKLAGIHEFKGYEPVSLENISHTANALKQKEKRLGIQPGDLDWFKLWFTKPYLTGPAQFRGRKK
jgi:hypothetical protein|tara:strand:+ start:297 stop:509 length:213 start_codon:yes stop_codon:yes gene_type:complete